jgi:hypothetical protein
MRGVTSRFLRLLFALQGVVACTSDGPAVVAARNPVAPIPTTPTPPAKPSPSPPSVEAIYDRVTSSFFGDSRYAIYADDTFSLQYLTLYVDYSGRYSRTDSTIKFAFDGANSAGPWFASGIIRGDSTLIVTYNLVMGLADFEDGVYRSAAPLPTLAPSSVGHRR